MPVRGTTKPFDDTCYLTPALSVPTEPANAELVPTMAQTHRLLWLHVQKIMSSRLGLVSSFLANAFWLLIYLISFNRSVIEIHQNFLSVRSPLMSVGFQHLLRLHYQGFSLGPLMPQSDKALVTEIINLKTLFSANAFQELFNSHACWCPIREYVFCQINVMKCLQITLLSR